MTVDKDPGRRADVQMDFVDIDVERDLVAASPERKLANWLHVSPDCRFDAHEEPLSPPPRHSPLPPAPPKSRARGSSRSSDRC